MGANGLRRYAVHRKGKLYTHIKFSPRVTEIGRIVIDQRLSVSITIRPLLCEMDLIKTTPKTFPLSLVSRINNNQ